MLKQQNFLRFIIMFGVECMYYSECNGSSSFNERIGFKDSLLECWAPVFENGKYTILGNGHYVQGDPIPNFAIVNFTCINDNYALTTTNSLEYCINGNFQNELPKCVPTCGAITSTPMDVECELNGIKQDCSKKVPEGTIASMKCKTHYVEIGHGLSKAICSGGSWHIPPIQCIPECGELVPKAQTLIVNGTAAKKGEFPWHVAIYRQELQEPPRYECGGSIISVKLVLSAAHCFTTQNNGKLFPTSEFSVAAGKYFSNWDAPEDTDFVQKRRVSKIEYQNDIYLGYQSNFADDIAVVVVDKPFVLTNLVRPVCVDWHSNYVDTHLRNGTFGQVAGWGFTTTGNRIVSIELKQITAPFIDRRQCLEMVPQDFKRFISIDKYCAGYTNGTSVCIGDNGGGMVFPQEEYKGKRYYIQGIVSFGPQKDGACDDHQLGVYTKVASHIHFIKKIEASNRINNKEDCDGKNDCSDKLDEKYFDNKKPEECLPPVIENGDYRVLENNEYRYRNPIPNLSLVNITCVNTNYVLSTLYSTVYCVQGNYSHEMPKCLFTCISEFPTSIYVTCKYNYHDYATDCMKDVPEGTVANMECKRGFIDKNPEISKITCTANGKWDGPPKQCSSPYTCPPRLSTAIDVFCELNGVLQDCNKEVPDGTIARMKCKKNYIDVKNGPSIATCSNGSWSVPPKKCIPDCERITQEGQTFIVNGESTNRGDFPWHVAIYRQKPEEPIDYQCGGSIINVKTVISAAHCLTDANNGNINPVSEYFVAAGKKYSKWDATEDDFYVQKRKVTKIHTPRDTYFGQLSSYAGDIAVVVVDKQFTFTNFISPICIDWNSEYVNEQLKNGELGKIAGWGSVTTGNPLASVQLKQLTIPYVTRNQCVEIVPKHFIPYLTVDKFCAGYTNGSSVCGGDSGGGMVFPRVNRYYLKEYYLQGIISAGPTKDGQCDDYQLGVYTKVSNYLTFIREIEESNRV